jgi:hypothetical protein
MASYEKSRLACAGQSWRELAVVVVFNVRNSGDVICCSDGDLSSAESLLTSRRCFTRFKEHNRPSLDSHVRTHIEKCQTFQKLLKKETKKRYPSLCDRRKFLLPKFSILHKNINKYSQRIMFENIEIQLRKPSINKQNESTKIRFLS